MTTETDENARHPALSPQERRTMTRAIRCLEAAYSVKGQAIAGPQDARDYLKLRLYGLPYEVFACLLLDNRHRIIRYSELFRGTIGGASCPQSSERGGGTEPVGSAHHPEAQGRPGPDRRAGVGSPHRGRRRWYLAGGAWTPVTGAWSGRRISLTLRCGLLSIEPLDGAPADADSLGASARCGPGGGHLTSGGTGNRETG